MTALGALQPIAWDVRDEGGALVTASTVTLTITLPDGTTATPPVPVPAIAGQYRVAWPTTMAGRHTAVAVTTGPVTVYDTEFDVDDETPPAIVSLGDAKQQLHMDPADTSDDDELRAFIYGTTAALEQYVHEVIVRRAFTDSLQLCCARRFRLWHAPVISLTSVALWDGSQTWDVTGMRVSESGVVRVLSGPPVHGYVDVVLLAGYQAVPYNYRRGALVMLAHLWETQRGAGTIQSGVIGPEEHYRQPGEFFTVPNKVKEWCGPPRPVVA